MPNSISKFRSSFKSDLARPHRFDVLIPIPIALLPYYSSSQQLSMRCDTTALPSRSFFTVDRKIGSVPVQKFPYVTQYEELPMSFLIGGDMGEKILFDAWMEIINPSSNFNFSYKKTYVTEIAVRQYDITNQLSYEVILIDAFPVSVGQMQLDWSNEGYHKLDVTFAYTYWTNGTLNQVGKNLAAQAINGIQNILNKANY